MRVVCLPAAALLLSLLLPYAPEDEPRDVDDDGTDDPAVFADLLVLPFRAVGARTGDSGDDAFSVADGIGFGGLLVCVLVAATWRSRCASTR